MSAVLPKASIAPSSTGDVLLDDFGEHRDLDCGDQSPPNDPTKFWMKDELFCSGHTVLADSDLLAAADARARVLAIQDKDLKRPGVAGSRPTATGLSVVMPTQDAPTEAVLMTLGSMTHSFDMHQRCVEVAISGVVAGNQAGHYAFTVTMPPEQWTPPGYHMLFILDRNHVPSPAVVVHLQ